MRNLKILALLIVVFLVTYSTAAQAQGIETRKVSFPKGKSGTSITSTVKGDQTIDYLVAANAGQELKVSLTTNNSSNYFNVIAPASTDEAIFIGSSEGNKFQGTLSASGNYKIRVYLMRNAARRNEQAKFTLNISATGGSTPSSTDAKVSGTPYHATGMIPAAIGSGSKGSVQADFGVIRNNDKTAEVHVTMPGKSKRVLFYKDGTWTCLSQGCNIQSRRPNADEWEVIINNNEHYFIFNEVVFGG